MALHFSVCLFIFLSIHLTIYIYIYNNLSINFSIYFYLYIKIYTYIKDLYIHIVCIYLTIYIPTYLKLSIFRRKKLATLTCQTRYRKFVLSHKGSLNRESWDQKERGATLEGLGRNWHGMTKWQTNSN